MKKYILFFILSLVLWGCPTLDPSQEMIIVNNCTDSAIYVSHSCFDSLPRTPVLNLFEVFDAEAIDSRGHNKKGKLFSPNYRINAYTYSSIGIPASDLAFNKCNNMKIWFFFVTEKTIREITWDEIYKNQLYKTKICFNYEELKQNNWTIEYK